MTKFSGFDMGPRTVMVRIAALPLARDVITNAHALLQPALASVEACFKSPAAIATIQLHATNPSFLRAEKLLSNTLRTILKCQRIRNNHVLEKVAISLQRELSRVHAVRRRLTCILRKTQRNARRIPKKPPLDIRELQAISRLLAVSY